MNGQKAEQENDQNQTDRNQIGANDDKRERGARETGAYFVCKIALYIFIYGKFIIDTCICGREFI